MAQIDLLWIAPSNAGPEPGSISMARAARLMRRRPYLRSLLQTSIARRALLWRSDWHQTATTPSEFSTTISLVIGPWLNPCYVTSWYPSMGKMGWTSTRVKTERMVSVEAVAERGGWGGYTDQSGYKCSNRGRGGNSTCPGVTGDDGGRGGNGGNSESRGGRGGTSG